MLKKYLINKMVETIEQNKLLENGDRVVVGVSGGADSVALLMALRELVSKYNLNLIVCHVNHKMRPGAAEEDQRFVQNLCDDLGIPCHVKIADVERLAKKWNMSDEEAGRKVRYDFFNEIALNNGKIATAHNKNDNAETVMMRFMRGTGLHGLTGIPYKRGNIIRPLLDVTRDEIEQYLKEIDQDHITDGTNLMPIYTRNKIRLNLIPEIQKEFNPNFIETLTNNIANYRDDDDYLTMKSEQALKEFFVLEKDNIRISKAIALAQHVAIIRRSIRLAFLHSFKIELSSVAVNNIVNLLDKPNGTKLSVVDEVVASVQYSGIVIQNGSIDKIMCEFKIDSDVISKPGVFHTNNETISYEIVTAENIINNSKEFYYPIDMCKNGFTMRTRRDGDIVVVAPGIRKKLKKFFVDEKVDAANRDDYWLLINDKNEVVWIPGLFGSRLSNENRNGKMVRFRIN